MQARLTPDSHDAKLHFDTAAVYLKRAFCQDPSNPAYQISLEQADAKVHEQIWDSQWSSAAAAAAAATEFHEQIHDSQWPATKVLERHTEIINHGLGQQSKGSSARKVPQCSIEPFLPSQDSIAVVDRISELPDELLCHILSFLPTKFSFTTTLLSKRWTPLFYSLPLLHFNDVNFKDFQTYDRFCNFVDNLMIHPLSINHDLPLKKFRFNQCYRRHRRNLFARKKDIHNINAWLEVATQLPREKDIHIINTWLEVLMQRRVEEFDLKLYFHTLKPIIFISETLTILKLSTLKVGNEVAFSLGKGSFFPSWESYFLTIRSIKEHTFIIVSLHYIFLHTIINYHSLSSIPLTSMSNNIRLTVPNSPSSLVCTFHC